MYKNLVASQVIWSPEKGTLAFSGTLLLAVTHDKCARFISSCCCNIWTPTSYTQPPPPPTPSTEGMVYVQLSNFCGCGISFLAPQIAQTIPRGQPGNYPQSKIFSCH